MVEYRRKRKLREKKKKEEKKHKIAAKKDINRSDRQKYSGNKEEIAGMIRKLNAMNINDPEYAPIYYKVMVMDQSGTAEKCVKPPFVERVEARTRGPQSPATAAKPETPSSATFPNNIPLGQPQRYGPGSDFKGCYGCLEDGHRIFECRQIAELVHRNVIAFDEETRRYTMAGGGPIRRLPGESLVKAAKRAAAGNVPRVMFGVIDRSMDQEKAMRSFYQAETRRPRIVELSNGSSADEEYSDPENSTGTELSNSSEEEYEEVYLTVPKRKKHKGAPYVQQVDRTVPSTRTARWQVFDGVYPPSRERSRVRASEKSPERVSADRISKPNGMTSPVAELPLQPSPEDPERPQEKSKTNKVGPLPGIIPVEARKVRFEGPEEVEMTDLSKDKPRKKTLRKNIDEKEKELTKVDEAVAAKVVGCQSELLSTVDRQKPVWAASQAEENIRFGAASNITRKGERTVRNENDNEELILQPMRERLRDLEHESWMRLASAGARFLNSVVAWFDFFGKEFLEQGSEKNAESPGEREYKRERRVRGSLRRLPSPHATEMSSPAPEISSIIEPPLRSGNSSQHRSRPTDYGPPLFLSRMRHHHPYEPILTKPSDDPIAIVEAAINRFWENSNSEPGVACEPTFSAAPLSEYYGAVTLPGGQRLHHSLGLDSFKVLMNPETGRPFCVIGHEISIFVELPTDPDEPWEFEIPFPPPRLLRSAMTTIMPHDPPREGETGFPMHTTEHALPMMNAKERLEARLVCDLSETQQGEAYGFQRRHGIVRPSDVSSGGSDSSSDRSPPSSGTASSSAAGSSSNDTTLVDALAEDILKRVKKDVALQLTNEIGESLDVAYDGLPGLVSEELTDEEEESAPIRTGICPVCFELEHFPVDCPTAATTNHGGAPRYIRTDHGESLAAHSELSEGGLFYLDDVVAQHWLISRMVDNERASALQRAHQVALAPTLNALFTLPPLEAAWYIHLMDAARRVREAFEDVARKIETQYTEDGVQVLEDATREMEEAITKLATADPSTATAATVPEPDLVLRHMPLKSTPPHLIPTRDGSSQEKRGPALPRLQMHLLTMLCFSRTQYRSRLSLTAQAHLVITEHPELEQSSPVDATHNSAKGPADIMDANKDPSIEPVTSHEAHDRRDRFLIQFGDASNSEQRDVMCQWLVLGREHMGSHDSQENSVGSEPIRHAFEILRGPLHDFVDFVPVEATSLQRSQTLSPLSLDLRDGQRDSDALPDPSQSPTSLDFSLPSPPADDPALPTNITDADVTEAGLDGTTQGNAGLKRKAPMEERLREFQEGPRKRFPRGPFRCNTGASQQLANCTVTHPSWPGRFWDFLAGRAPV
ncbi:hypothetical protein FB451DRAFT_1510759 [Mycena latifolia]|nr:hypothetical protein FB451DRAFT_1510759 [Mycena latifolia]